jgi:hypothetical protein
MKHSVFFIAGFFFSLALTAQTEAVQDAIPDSAGTRSFFENIYFETAFGSQALFSSDVENLEWNDRFTPFFSLAVGKWISPFWGAEIKAEGLSLNGFSTAEGTYTAVSGNGSLFEQDPVRSHVTIHPDGTYRHFIRYANVSVHLYASLAHLLLGKEKQTKLDFVPSAGIGNMHLFPYKGIPKNNTLSVSCGLTGKWYLTPHLDITMRGTAVFFNNNFEGRIAGTDDYEKYVAASAGLVWYLKPRILKDIFQE